ncbi:MAG TPA: polyprenyl synthetase family protein, partial [Chloroflexota bacterium]
SEMTSPLLELQRRYGPLVEEELRRRLTSDAGPASFLGMLSYQMGHVDDNLYPVEGARGKRFRPLLCMLACESVGGEAAHALSAAAAIELLHNFSLIHDDIEDRDPSRRHRPTVWKVWGEAQGLNAGDAMHALASRAILDAIDVPTVALDVARGFQDTARALTEGQFMDMSFETRTDVRPDEYLVMIEKKSAALIAFSLWSGARLGGAHHQTLDAMHAFGMELGKAFQIHDDISGIWAEEHQTGKEPGKDLRNGKKTLPVLIALENAGAAQRARLEAYLGYGRGDITDALDVLEDAGSRRHAEDFMREYLAKALDALSEARIERWARAKLEKLAEELTGQRAASS